MQSGAQKTWMSCGTLLFVGILGPTRNIGAAQSPTSVSGPQIILTPESSQKVINGAPERFTGAVRVQSLFDAKERRCHLDSGWCKHWHCATPTSSVTHIAIQENLDGRNVDWLEKVSDEQYRLSK
jgi:hypothetical protein